MTDMTTGIARQAPDGKSWLAARRWLTLRRASQLGVLGIFLAGPWLGLWIVKGNLNFSLILDTVPLGDPYVLLQSLFAGHVPESRAVAGALIVLAFYFLVGGRAYCSWVCPVNIVTDIAAWLRDLLGIKAGAHIGRESRYWILGMTLVLAASTGTIAWELVNPVSMLHRGVIFGMGAAWAIVASVFLFDVFVVRRGWCGHLCPAGAFYSVIGRFSPVRVIAAGRAHCNDCMDCFAVCPEPMVIKPALKGADRGIGPVIASPNCTNCGRCIDVCEKKVFSFGARIFRRGDNTVGSSMPVEQKSF